MEQACWHSGVDAAMGFCVVDWGGKDLGWKALVEDLVVAERFGRALRAERVGLFAGYAGSPLRGRRLWRWSFAALCAARSNRWVRMKPPSPPDADIKKAPLGALLSASGGEGGIRTHGGRKSSAVFKTAAFDHSATSPMGANHT